MPRMPLDDLQTLITSTVPDNITGLVSPEDVRTMLLNIIQSMQPAYSFMWGDHQGTPIVVNVGNTWQPIAGVSLYTDTGLSDPAELPVNPTTGSMAVQFPDYVHSMSGSITVSGSSGREFSLALGHDGVPIDGIATTTLGGTPQQRPLFGEATFIARTGWNLQLLCRFSDGGAAANVNFYHARFEGSLQPTRTAD